MTNKYRGADKKYLLFDIEKMHHYLLNKILKFNTLKIVNIVSMMLINFYHVR